MITENYVSYEVAKLLKEKGFDESCECFYDTELYDTKHNDISIVNEWMNISNSQLEEREFLCYSAPTLQMAMKWLREVHKLAINIEFQIDSPTWKWRIYHIEPSEDKHTNFKHYSTYEEACESAIKYCLENLI